MCSGIWPRSSAARSRILTLSFMCFWPIYSSQRVGRRVWSKKDSSLLAIFSGLDLIEVFGVLLDIGLELCYICNSAVLSTHYQHSYAHYSTCCYLYHSTI